MIEQVYNYSQYCAYRLPCGICSRTNAICPLNCGIEVTWASDGTSVTVNNIESAERKEALLKWNEGLKRLYPDYVEAVEDRSVDDILGE